MRSCGLPVTGPQGLWRNLPSPGPEADSTIELNLLLSTCSMQNPVLGAGGARNDIETS